MDYTTLITSEHADKPNYVALVSAITGDFDAIRAAIASLPLAFDLDVAQGVQLDVVGEWVGLSRQINTPVVGVYFAFDTDGVGFDQGVWMGPFDPPSGISVMDDGTYRTLIRAKIGANHWDGTVPGWKAVMDQVFPPSSGTYVSLDDNQDMSMTIGVAGILPNALLVALITQNYLPLRPAGILVNYKVTTIPGAPLFGFDVENNYISGFDVGAWGQ